MADNDLISLEIKITYLEEALATLNELLIDQTKEIQFLKERLKKIENKIEEGKLDNTSLPFEKPPHY
ncbi:MAG: SlyX family protein [Sphaerochaetaceae bacterium]